MTLNCQAPVAVFFFFLNNLRKQCLKVLFIFITDETFVQKQVLNPSFSFFNKSWDPQIPFFGYWNTPDIFSFKRTQKKKFGTVFNAHVLQQTPSSPKIPTFFTLKTPSGIVWGGSLLYFSDLDSFVLSFQAQRGRSQQPHRKKESTIIGKTLQKKAYFLCFFLRHWIELDKKSNNVMYLKLSSY